MIIVEKLNACWLYILPLPPSTNARTRPIIVAGHAQEILTKEARQYLDSVGNLLKVIVHSRGIHAVHKYTRIGFWFILPRTNCDPHNYFKCLCDVLERSGVVSNDKFILPNVGGVWHDSKDPRAIVLVPHQAS